MIQIKAVFGPSSGMSADLGNNQQQDTTNTVETRFYVPWFYDKPLRTMHHCSPRKLPIETMH